MLAITANKSGVSLARGVDHNTRNGIVRFRQHAVASGLTFLAGEPSEAFVANATERAWRGRLPAVWVALRLGKPQHERDQLFPVFRRHRRVVRTGEVAAPVPGAMGELVTKRCVLFHCGDMCSRVDVCGNGCGRSGKEGERREREEEHERAFCGAQGDSLLLQSAPANPRSQLQM